MRNAKRLAALLAVSLTVLATTAAALTQPAAEIVVDSPVRGLEIDPNRERVDLDLVLYNRTDQRRTVRFLLDDVPEGWNIAVWSRFFDFRILDFAVEPTAADPDRIQQARIRIQAPPAADRQPGTYSFTLRVVSPDETIEYDRVTYTIVAAEPREAYVGGVSVRTGIPSIRAAPGAALGYDIIVRNDTGEETAFNLSAEAPAGWQVTFRQTLGDRSVIGAVTVRSGLTERVRVDVRSPQGAPLGEYTIPVHVTSERGQASLTLRAELTGQGQIQASSVSGSTLVRAAPGGAGVFNVRLTNTGTDMLRNVPLTTTAPEGWSVAFNVPDNTVDELPASYQIDIEAIITPPRNAAPGDYVVRIQAGEGLTSAAMDTRVTVARSSIWEWVGVGLVVVLVGGAISAVLNPRLVLGKLRR